MGKSLYSGNKNAKLIYSYKKRAPCCVDDVCLTSSLLSSFQSLLTQVYAAVSTLFPALDAKSMFVADIPARACIPAPIFARLLWRRAHPGDTWTGGRVQVLQLLDIYLQHGMSYAGDPFFDDTLACLPGAEFPVVEDDERAIVDDKTTLDSTDSVLKEVVNAGETASATDGAGSAGTASATSAESGGTSAGSDDDPQTAQRE